MEDQLHNFHDGLLTGIAIEDKVATISLRRTDGREFVLTLSGLEVLQMEDFRQGNIISMIEIICGETPYHHAGFERLFGPPHPSAAEKYHQAHASVITKQSARIATGEMSLVVIVPSYGADLLAMCRQVSLSARSGDYS